MGPADKQAATEVVVDSMTAYAKHTIRAQLADPVDGLKRIHRRALWTLKDVRDAKKGVSVIGNIMSLHPYGDSAIWTTITLMMQPFSNMFPLIAGIGGVGSYYGDPPSAARYLDVKQAPFAMDVYFNGINLTRLDFIPSELGDGTVEPLRLVPKIPMALINAVFGLTVGFQTNTLPYNFRSVCQIAMLYIKTRGMLSSPTAMLARHPEWLIPDSYVPSLIRNSPQIKHNVRQGKLTNTVVYDGTMTLTANTVTLRTLPYGTHTRNTLHIELTRRAEDKNDPLFNVIQLVNEATTDLIDIELVLKRGVDVFDVLDLIKKALQFTHTFHPKMLWVTDDGTAQTLDIDGVLDVWYNARHRSIMADFNDQQTKLVIRHRQCEARCKVVGHIDTVVRIIKKAATRADAVLGLATQFNLTTQQAEYLAAIPIGQLTSQGTDELEAQLAGVKASLIALKDKFSNVHRLMTDEIVALMEKYKKDRMAKLPTFQGVAQFENGVIQYWNDSEAHRLMLSFKPENTQLHVYPSGIVYRYAIVDGVMCDEEDMHFPKECRAQAWFVSKRKLNQTIALWNTGGLYRLNRLIARGEPGLTFVPVSDTCTTISSTGEMNQVPVTSIALRKQAVSSGTKSDVTHVSHVTNDSLIVLHTNTREKNTIRVDHVQHGDRIQKLPMGTTTILGVYVPNEPLIINVPEDIRKRNTIHHIYVANILDIMKGKPSMRIYLHKKQTTTGVNLTKHPHGMMQLTVS